MTAPNASTRPRANGLSPDIQQRQDGLPDVVRADASRALHLAGLIGHEFRELPPSVWLVDSRKLRPMFLRDYFAIATEYAASGAGMVETLADESAVAVWFDNTRPHPTPPDYDRRLLAATGRYYERFVALDGELNAHHPTEPHHHLAFIAVAEQVRGTGRAAKLLRHHHDQLDAGYLPAYLEAASPALVTLYRSFGYQPRDPFPLPAGGPAFHPMWRDPVVDVWN
jgi:GNAT superfamily N-acetyltransferase